MYYIYIYMHMDAPFCDVVLVVRMWMRLMMCYMFVLHVDASSLRMVGTWMSLVYFMWCDICMIRHVDTPMDTNVVLWFYVYGCKCWCNAIFLGFYIFWWDAMQDGGVTWCDWYANLGCYWPFDLRHYCKLLEHVWIWWIQTVGWVVLYTGIF